MSGRHASSYKDNYRDSDGYRDSYKDNYRDNNSQNDNSYYSRDSNYDSTHNNYKNNYYDDSANNYEQDRSRKRRSRSRSNSRDRKRSNFRDDNNSRGTRFPDRETYRSNGLRDTGGPSRSFMSEPSKTVMIKGLPSHTTELTLQAILGVFTPESIRLIMHRDGECKGFAFVEFPTIEHAQYFMGSYAGSFGDQNAPQLIIENRAVVLDYARDSADRKERGEIREDRKIRSDWLCSVCDCHNFAKRGECFKCGAPRTDNCATVSSSGSDPFPESVVGCDTPSVCLVARGLTGYVTEDQITEVFRQFAVVKSVQIVRDPASKFMKAVAFIEFFTVEHATYALQNCRTIQIGRDSVRVAFAREAVMNQLLSQQNFSAVAPGMMGGMPMVANAGNFALQAAQWSMGVPPAGNISSGQTSINYVKPDTTWPPSFENFGGAYTFQPRSGYFYESNSEFYYCPKSKLYYSGKDGYYYSYDNNASPPFVRYYPQAPTEPDTAIPGIALIDKTDEAKSAEANNDAAASRQPISISLGGSFKLKAMKSSAPVKSAGKKALNDIAKWGARLREENDEKNATDDTKKDEMHKEEDPNSAFKKAVKPQQPAISMSLLTQAEMDLLKAGKQRSGTSAPDAFKFNAGGSSGSSTPLPSEKSAAAGTTSSQKVSTTPAICHLCRRQFPSSEVLARHERESKLHAENLLKAEAANSNNT